MIVSRSTPDFDSLARRLDGELHRGFTLRHVYATDASEYQELPAAVVMIWLPVKDRRESDATVAALTGRAHVPMLTAQLWLYPRDSRVSLNGSCILVANPPWQTADRMRVWLPAVYENLKVGDAGGIEVRFTDA